MATIEPLEHNTELGVYVSQSNNDGDGQREIYFAQFNPKFNFLVTAGSGLYAHLWDLRREEMIADPNPHEIPHVKPTEQQDAEKMVTSLDWNTAGDKLLTSSSDMVARVW